MISQSSLLDQLCDQNIDQKIDHINKFNVLYTAALTYTVSQSDSDDYFKNTAIEEAAMTLSIYELSLKVKDSTFFEKILQLSDKSFWIKICKNKIQNFIDYDVFELVECSEDADILIISDKWVFKYKHEFNNQILK